MKISYLVLVISFIAFAGCSAKHAKKDGDMKNAKSSTSKSTVASAEGKVTCKLDKDLRTIEKRVSDNNRCEVVYTKNGAENIVANADNDPSYCDQKLTKTRGNLENAGFSCN